MINAPYIAWLAAAALIAPAWVVVIRIRPNQDRHSCQTVLFLCTLGMLLGLAIDACEGRLAMLDTLCRSGTRSPIYWIGIHWQQLPAMHAGMLAGSLLTLTRRCALRDLGCCAFMATGMALGSLVHTPSIMLASMVVGMTWGHTAANVWMRRLAANDVKTHVVKQRRVTRANLRATFSVIPRKNSFIGPH